MKTSAILRHLSVVALLTALFSQMVAQTKPRAESQAFLPLKTSIKKEAMASRLEQLIPQLMQEGGVPGLSILVIREGKIFWQRGFGVKNAETRTPVDAETVFEAASLSKPVVAYAVLKLADSGR